MSDVDRPRDGLEIFREQLGAVAARVIEDALKAPTARERTQSARLIFDILGLRPGAGAAQLTVQARGSTHMLTDELTLDEVDIRLTGLDASAAGDVRQIVQGLGLRSRTDAVDRWQRALGADDAGDTTQAPGEIDGEAPAP